MSASATPMTPSNEAGDKSASGTLQVLPSCQGAEATQSSANPASLVLDLSNLDPTRPIALVFHPQKDPSQSQNQSELPKTMERARHTQNFTPHTLVLTQPGAPSHSAIQICPKFKLPIQRVSNSTTTPTKPTAATVPVSGDQPTAGASNANQTREYTSAHLQSLADGVGLTLTDWHLHDSRVTRPDPIRFGSEEIIYYMISSRLPKLSEKVGEALKSKPADLSGTRLGVVLDDYFDVVTQSPYFHQMLREFGKSAKSRQTSQDALHSFLMTRVLPPAGIILFDRMITAVLMGTSIALKNLKQGNTQAAIVAIRLVSKVLEITDHRRNIVRNGWALMQGARDELINRASFDLFNTLRADKNVKTSGAEGNVKLENQVSPYLVVPTVAQSSTQATAVAGASVIPSDSAALCSAQPVPSGVVGGSTAPLSMTPAAGTSGVVGSSTAPLSMATAAGTSDMESRLSPSPNTCSVVNTKKNTISKDGQSRSGKVSSTKRKPNSPSSRQDSKREASPVNKRSLSIPEQSEPEEDFDDNYYFSRLAQSGVISQEEAAMQQAIAAVFIPSRNLVQKENSMAQASTSTQPDEHIPSREECFPSEISPHKHKSLNDPEQREQKENVDDDHYYFNRLAQSGVISQEEASMQQAIASTLMSSGAQVQEEGSTEKDPTSARHKTNDFAIPAVQLSAEDLQLMADIHAITQQFEEGNVPEAYATVGGCGLADLILENDDNDSLTGHDGSSLIAAASGYTDDRYTQSEKRDVSASDNQSQAGKASGYARCSPGSFNKSKQASPKKRSKSFHTKGSNGKGKKPKKGENLNEISSTVCNKQSNEKETRVHTALSSPANAATTRNIQESDDVSSEEEIRLQTAILDSFMFGNP